MAIYKKGNDYYIDYYVNGQRKRERIGPSKSLAKDVLTKRKCEIAEGRFFPERTQNHVTFREMAELFWDQHARHLKSSHSVRLRLDRLIEYFGDKPLRSITPLMVSEFRNEIRKPIIRTVKGHPERKIEFRPSAATANRFQAILRSIFYKAQQWRKFFGENPAAVIKLEKESTGRLRFLSNEEIPNLLKACDPEIYPLVVTALTTGMRRGEIFNLKWQDVNLENRIIYIVESKSGKPREIPITSKLFTVLESLPRTGEVVFNVPPATLRIRFEKAVKGAGLSDFRFHDLRHTFASHFVMKTADLPALMKLLGHHSTKMTQRYAHLSNGHIRSEMEILDASWTPRWTPTPQVQVSSEKVIC